MKEWACASVRPSGGSLRGVFRRRRLAPGSRSVRQSVSQPNQMSAKGLTVNAWKRRTALCSPFARLGLLQVGAADHECHAVFVACAHSMGRFVRVAVHATLSGRVAAQSQAVCGARRK